MNVHIVFARDPNRPEHTFVEIEDGQGNSISVGRWVERDDGLVALVLDVVDEPKDGR